MIRLFTTWYAEGDEVRYGEYVECLRRNLECTAIDEVCVLAERSTPPIPPSSRLRVVQVAARPLYSNYLDCINELASPDDISAIANADIFFDESVGMLASWRPQHRTVLALSRWDISGDGRAVLYDHNDSQDSWIFRGPTDGVRGDFPVGVPRCDNRFAKELELAGYSVRNPSFSLRSFHLHAERRDAYSTEPGSHFVAPPYGYVWPHNLWPLHRTLWHNARHPRRRVGWRFDSRLWKRTLKLHWIRR